MDLKGSLIDVNLKIYPSNELIDVIKTIPPSDDLPHNIKQILQLNSGSVFKSYKAENKPVHLSNSDTENLIKIKKIFDEIESKLGSAENSDDQNVDNNTQQEIEKVENTIGDSVENNLAEDAQAETKELNVDEKTSKVHLNSKNSDCKEIVPFLVTSDIDWLYQHLKTRRSNGEKDIPYLHTLLDGASIEVPENETIKRNPVLEARCVKLRAQQEAREYRKMTKGVDNVRMRFPEDSISYQLKQLNRQLIAIGQFIISIFAGFLFGFRGVEWIVGNLDFGFRLLLGVMCALVIALAEIYFLAKKLNEELNIPETVQLGGPIKFADEQKNDSPSIKPHQD